MNDKKNSKARHARHAAPTPQPGSDAAQEDSSPASHAAQEDSSPASHAAPPKSAAPAKTPQDAPAPGKVAPGKPVPGQTAVMPQPVRPVAPNAKAKPGGQPG